MEIVNLDSDKKISSLAKKVADEMFNNVNTTVGIMISQHHDLISFPTDRFGHDSTLAVMIPKAGHKEHINFFTDLLEVKGRFNEQLEYIILIGRQTLSVPEKKQIDIFKHELQHVKQSFLQPTVLAKNCLLDIVLDLLGEKGEMTPSEMDARSMEEGTGNSLLLWMNETSSKFEQYKKIVGNVHKAIEKSDSIIQLKLNDKKVTKTISPELTDLFEFHYKRALTSKKL